MKKITTILCSLAFLLCGVLMADVFVASSSDTGYKTMSAATLSSLSVPAPSPNSFLPQDLLLDLEKNALASKEVTVPYEVDSLKQRIADLEKRQVVTKVKWKRVPVPITVVKRDTIREAHYYLATQVGNKEGPEGECIPIYEVHKVNEVCPEITNSSVGKCE